MKSLKIHPGLLLGLLVVAMLLTSSLYLNREQSGYSKILQKCDSSNKARYSDCLKDQLLSFADTNPASAGQFMTYIYHNARRLQPIDLRSFSDSSHSAGMLMAGRHIDLIQAAKDCGDSFEGGCLHGFVMEKLDNTHVSPDRLSAMTEYCRPLEGNTGQSTPYLNCLHGIGHEIWAKGRTTLGSALSYCDPLHQEYLKNACWSGVLMEYSKTGVSTGHHSHTAVGVVELPCAALKVQYQATCYSAEGSYSQYEPNHETATDSYKYCGTIPAQYRVSCNAAVTTRLNLAVGARID
jgi:hypothetical protein